MEKFKTLLFLFLGGGFGTLLRYGTSKILNPISQNFYWSTFSVNIIGSLLLGFIIGLSLKNPAIASRDWFLFLSIGLCGGFTTFSTFAFENQGLLKNGQFLELGIYLISSIIFGIASIGLGIWLSKLA